MKLLLSHIILLLLVVPLVAQTTVKGTVYDEQLKEPLIGANILIENTSEGTTTELDGSFELTTSRKAPFTLIVSYTGYTQKELEITGSINNLAVALASDALTIETVEVRGQRISDKQKQSPLTVEALDNIAIKETASDNFYDGLGSLKGVDLTAASLGFKVINTRGFNSTSLCALSKLLMEWTIKHLD